MSTDQTLYSTKDVYPGIYLVCDTCGYKIDTSSPSGVSGKQYVGFSYKEDKFGVTRTKIRHVLKEGCEDASQMAMQNEEPLVC